MFTSLLGNLRTVELLVKMTLFSRKLKYSYTLWSEYLEGMGSNLSIQQFVALCMLVLVTVDANVTKYLNL